MLGKPVASLGSTPSNAVTILPNGHALTGRSAIDLVNKLFSLQERGLAELQDYTTYTLTPGGAQVRAAQSGSYPGQTNRATWAVAYTIEAGKCLADRVCFRFAVAAIALDAENKPVRDTWSENFVGTDRNTRVLGAIPSPPTEDEIKAGKVWPSLIPIFTAVPPDDPR
jgi:hypothetical protein